MTVSLVTVAEVKDVMPISGGNTNFDARIQRYIDIATSQIESATGREFDLKDRVELFRTIDSRDLRYDFGNTWNEDGVYMTARRQRYVLKSAPILTSPAVDVRYDPNRVWGDDTVVPPASYTVDYDEGTLVLIYPTSALQQALRIAYTAGYAAAGNPLTLSASIPATLKQACISQVQFLFSKLAGDNLGMSVDRSEGSVPEGRFTTVGGLCPEAAEMVSDFKRLAMGLG